MQVAVRRERIFSSDICVHMLTKPNRKRRMIQESILWRALFLVNEHALGPILLHGGLTVRVETDAGQL